MQQPTDESVDQRKGVPRPYLDIAHVPGQYLDIALVAGQYEVYCPVLAFDPPTQSVMLHYTLNIMHMNFINYHG